MSDRLQVQMLGGFSIRLGDRVIDDGNNRMRKVWLLLAYLIHFRNTHTTQAGCLALLQSGGEECGDPIGRLKTVLYRVRTMLNQLEDAAGHQWILRSGGSYVWNPEIPMDLDTDLFEALCRQAAEAADDAARLDLYLQAIDLYKGDFLPKLATETWVMPLNVYYHRMYLDAVQQALQLLEQAEQWPEAVALCERALEIEPYSETLYQHRMQCLIAADQRPEALQVYEQLNEMLFSNFGVVPSDESRELYRQACSSATGAAIPASSLRERLREEVTVKGALYCEYNFFRMLYQLQARVVGRSGEIIHIALFSVRSPGDKELSRRSLDTAMNNLQRLMISNLRQGDVVTRCSASQLIVMLHQANYEDSCEVCQRLLRAFGRQYPHTPVAIHYSVQPLEPLEPK
ncbi:MAG: bacterial transcriptional activator domain-containing protein [Clostridia bacterium]|nr:bacterial transcriptional activator domain-containing protein [Clostridia bacterium]